MGGLALLARSLGHTVSGSDEDVYPPMSAQLAEHGIRWIRGYEPASWVSPPPDRVIVGNALTRGNPSVEYLLDYGCPLVSGPQWLAEQVLAGRRVLAVAGTHGKTSTAAALAWLLERAGRQPGFLVGGIARNFGVSARLGEGEDFVVEADEYDTAFFDKRSKFLHYRPNVLIVHNIEFDHADIFEDLTDVHRQFHHLVRTLPRSGRIVARGGDVEIDRVLAMGCWTPVERYAESRVRWTFAPASGDWSRFRIREDGRPIGEVRWGLFGRHNAENAVAAVAAAAPVVASPRACHLLASFEGVRRRLERLGTEAGVEIYDDFAHHPTAIRATLQALRGAVGRRRILAALELASNTMRSGIHGRALGAALREADHVFLYRPSGLCWSLEEAVAEPGGNTGIEIHDSIGALCERAGALARSGDVVLVMSNGAFGGLPGRLCQLLHGKKP